MPPKKAKSTGKTDSKLPSRDKTKTEDPPTKEQAAEKEAEAENNQAQEEPEPEADDKDTKAPQAKAGQKRKEPPTKSKSESKTPRQGSRSSTRGKDKSGAGSASPKQLLNFLLNASALEYCFPSDDLEAGKSSKSYKSYSLTSPTSFTPFEHLVTAHLLSKPLSHKLGLRSTRTLLNAPFSLNTAEKIVKEGEKRVWEALEEAKTQHRQKTAAYIHGMAESYTADGGEAMYKLSEEANNDGPQGVIQHIKATVPGLGQTGGEIFCRRVQCVDGWGDALWPYADEKSLSSLREIGIPVDTAEELQSAIEREVDWDKVGDMGLQERDLSKGELVGEEEETQVQAEFVVVLERAVGCVLEGKVQELRKAAAEI
jgi:hypothetical protein